MSTKIGDIVHYVLPNGRCAGQHRPAIITRLWGTPTAEYTPSAQLQVFLDGTNDFEHEITGVMWAVSVSNDEEKKSPGTWHWPEEE